MRHWLLLSLGLLVTVVLGEACYLFYMLRVTGCTAAITPIGLVLRCPFDLPF